MSIYEDPNYSNGLDHSGINATLDYQGAWQQAYGGNYAALGEFLSAQGDRWKNMVDSNPYANINYRQSGFQRLLSNLGFRTKYDAAKEQAQLQSNEYLAGLMQKYGDEQYETPAQMAQRMREAGMNPDLQGIGDVAGAAKMPDDTNVMSPDTFADDSSMIAPAASAISSIGGMIGKCITGALGIAGTFQDLKSKRLDNASKELGVFFSALFASAYPDATQDFTQGKGSDDSGDPVDGSGVGESNFLKLVNSLGLSRREKKHGAAMEDLLRKGLKFTAESAETRAGMGEDLFKSYLNGKSGLFSVSGLNSDEVQDTLQILALFRDDVTEMVYDFENQTLKYKFKELRTLEKQNEKQFDYWTALNGTQQAVSQNETFESNIGSQNIMQAKYLGDDGVLATKLKVERDGLELKKRLNERQRKLVEDLDASANEGKWFSKALMATLTGINFVEDSGLGAAISQIVSAASGGIGAMLASPKTPDFNKNFEIQPMPNFFQ